MWKFILCLTALYFVQPLHARPTAGYYANPDIDELRLEIDDLKHALNTTQVELGLLDERLKKQNSAKDQHLGKEASSLGALAAQMANLEKKVSHFEKTLDQAASDLRTLSNSVNQTLSKIQNLENTLSSHDQRLGEVAKLKGTLTSISKAIGQRSAPAEASSTTSYRVKAGDSLEKIARHHHITVDALQKINNLSNDKIRVGQELRLPDDPS